MRAEAVTGGAQKLQPAWKHAMHDFIRVSLKIKQYDFINV